MRGSRRSAMLAGLVIISFLVLRALSLFQWDPSIFLHVGAQDATRLEYAEDRLGDVWTAPGQGHDGKYFYVLAHDPLLLDPKAHALVLDRPTYRSQRPLYPALAAPAGAFGEWGLVWALLAINIGAVAGGTWATAGLARAMGASPWWGLAFALNPGVLFEVIIGGAGALAWALAVGGLWALWERRDGWAAAALTAAALSREVMLLVVGAAALALWREDRRRAVRVSVPPIVAAAGWAVYVRLRLGVPLLTSESQELGAPLRGLLEAATGWAERGGTHLLFGVLTVALLAAVVVQARRRPSIVSYTSAWFALFAAFLTGQVWLHYFDVTRAVAPVFTLFALVAVSAREAPGKLRRLRRAAETAGS